MDMTFLHNSPLDKIKDIGKKNKNIKQTLRQCLVLKSVKKNVREKKLRGKLEGNKI